MIETQQYEDVLKNKRRYWIPSIHKMYLP